LFGCCGIVLFGIDRIDTETTTAPWMKSQITDFEIKRNAGYDADFQYIISLG
jgi:hypothetical protein